MSLSVEVYGHEHARRARVGNNRTFMTCSRELASVALDRRARAHACALPPSLPSGLVLVRVDPFIASPRPRFLPSNSSPPHRDSISSEISGPSGPSCSRCSTLPGPARSAPAQTCSRNGTSGVRSSSASHSPSCSLSMLRRTSRSRRSRWSSRSSPSALSSSPSTPSCWVARCTYKALLRGEVRGRADT